MPVFDLTVIPFLWRQAPDESILEMTSGMTQNPEGHELLWNTRMLLPIGELEGEGPRLRFDLDQQWL